MQKVISEKLMYWELKAVINNVRIIQNSFISQDALITLSYGTSQRNCICGNRDTSDKKDIKTVFDPKGTLNHGKIA